MAGTFATNGAFDSAQANNVIGAASTGIGVAANQSGSQAVTRNFTDDANPFVVPHIGNGALSSAGSSNSDSNTGQVMTGLAVTAGSGYTNGTYRIPTTGGGAGAVQGEILVTVAGGAITAAIASSVGGKFTAIPSVALTALGGGTGGAIVPTIGFSSPAYALGSGWGSQKSMRRVTATGAVADGAAIVAGWLNRSGRAMVAGESAFGVAA